MDGKDALPSWRGGVTKTAIVQFVEETVSGNVPVEERIAVFDADGTLWCEKPVPIEVDFILRRLADQAKADPTLRERQPWKAAYDDDNTWLGQAITEHYAGDDTKAALFLEGVGSAFAGVDVEDFEAQSASFLHGTRHPTLHRGYLETAYVPMVELLAYLEANGFTNRIVSGSGGDFLRPVSQQLFGIPPERVIGSASELQYTSTTARRRRSRSGRTPGGARSSPPGTRTATCRCSSSRTARIGRRCACSCSTTTPSASSPTRAGPRRP
jgi:phosphoserine phosphatase